MASFLNQRLTNAGWDALSTALGGGRLTFYKLQAGYGTIANDAAIMGMTALVAPVCDIPITSYVIEGNGQITLFGNINSKDIATGFDFRELGVFASIEAPVGGKGGTPTGPNIEVVPPLAPVGATSPVVPPPAAGTPLMYSYCNAYSSTDYIPGSGETTAVSNTVQVTIKIDEAENVVINILAGESFAVVNIGPPTVGAGPWSYTTANVAYLKRLVAGPATVITEDTNTITIGARQLTADLDLYVANGNPDISPNFSSIQKALDYLGQYQIPTTIQARIHVSAGTYTSANTIQISHPNSQNITIQGPQNNSQTGTGLTITGSSYNWSMSVNGLPNTSQFTVNQYAIVNACFGVSAGQNALGTGCFKVTAKTASSVTLLVPNYRSSFDMGGANTIRLIPLSVTLQCSTVNRAVVNVWASGIGRFQYMAVVAQNLPTLSMNAFVINGDSYLKCIGVYGFYLQPNSLYDNMVHGLAVNGGGVTAEWCAVTYCQNGFVVGSATLSMNGCASTYHDWFRSIWVEGGTIGFVYDPTYSGGNYQGLVVSNNGKVGIFASIPKGYLFIQYNNHWGAWMHAGGSMSFSTPQCTVQAQNNSLSLPIKYDVVVTNYGIVSGSEGIIGSRIFNTPVGVINSSGGLIN